MRFFLILVSLPILAQDNEWKDPVNDYFSLYDSFYDDQSITSLEGFVEKAELDKFKTSLKSTVDSLKKTFKDFDNKELLKIFKERSPDALKEACKKVGGDKGALTILQSGFDLKTAMKSLDESPKEFRETIGFIAKCIVGFFCQQYTKKGKVEYKINDVLGEIIDLKKADYGIAFLRFISDNTFAMGVIQDKLVKGTDSEKKTLLKEITEDKVNLKDNESSFKKNPTAVCAYVRWNVQEAKNNFDAVDNAIKLDQDNGFYNYVRAYSYFFTGEDEKIKQALKLIKEGNTKKHVKFYNTEIMDDLSSLTKGQMKYFVSQNQIKMHHLNWLQSVASNTIFIVDTYREQKKDKEAIEVLEDTIQAVDKCIEASNLFQEYLTLVTTQVKLLQKKTDYYKEKKDEKKYIQSMKALADTESLQFTISLAVPYDIQLVVFLQSLFLDDDDLSKTWGKLKDKSFDKGLIKEGEKRLKDYVVKKLLKDKPELGGDMSNPDYQKAKELFDAKKYIECVEKVYQLMTNEPDHLHGFMLKREALAKIN